MKKIPIAKHSAASRKAWRTRKKMKAAREQFLDELRAQYDKDAAAGFVEPRKNKTARIVVEQNLNDPSRINVLFAPELSATAAAFADTANQTIDPKRRYRRLLPCPNFGEKR